jgi:hypothetical protein
MPLPRLAPAALLTICTTAVFPHGAPAQSMLAPSVRITQTPSGLLVSWPAVPRASAYRIDRVKEGDPCCNYSVTVAGSTTSIPDAVSPSVEGAYQYTVTATIPNYPQVALQGSYYQYVLEAPPINRRNPTIVTPCTPAQITGGVPPATVTGMLAATTNVSITWAAVPDAVGYLVERENRVAKGTWYTLGCLPASQTAFSERTRSDVPPDQTPYPQYGAVYKYKITAFTAAGAAGWNSGTVSMQAMSPPSALTATRTGNSVKLCWSAAGNQYTRPSRFRITSSYGSDFTLLATTGYYSGCSTTDGTTVLGVPIGTWTFKVTSLYYAIPNFLEYQFGPSVSVTVVP